MQTQFLEKLENLCHKNLPNILFSVKVVLIPVTIIYFIFDFVIFFQRKKSEDEMKALNIVNLILFYMIAVFVTILSSLLLFITRHSSVILINEVANRFRKKNKIKAGQIMIPKKYLGYYMSVIWWTLLYFLIATILVIISKINHDNELVYFMF